METETISLPPIVLRWSAWHSWHAIAADARSAGGVAIPHQPGVYEARYADARPGEYLHIGKASSLRFRVKQGLVKGVLPHSAGQSIRATEDLSRIVVRWAATDRPAAVEEDLHRRYRERFSSLPKHT